MVRAAYDNFWGRKPRHRQDVHFAVNRNSTWLIAPMNFLPRGFPSDLIIFNRKDAAEAAKHDPSPRLDAFLFPLALSHLGQGKAVYRSSDPSVLSNQRLIHTPPDQILRAMLTGKANVQEAEEAPRLIVEHEFKGFYRDVEELMQRVTYFQFRTADGHGQPVWVTASLALCAGRHPADHPHLLALAPWPWMDFGADLVHATDLIGAGASGAQPEVTLLESSERLWLWFQFLAAVYDFIVAYWRHTYPDSSLSQEQLAETSHRFVCYLSAIDSMRGLCFPSPGTVLLVGAEGFPEWGLRGSSASRIRDSLPWIRQELHLEPYTTRDPFRPRRVKPSGLGSDYRSESPLDFLVDGGRDIHSWQEQGDIYEKLVFEELGHHHPLNPITWHSLVPNDPLRLHGLEVDPRWLTAQLQPFEDHPDLFPDLQQCPHRLLQHAAVRQGKCEADAVLLTPPLSWNPFFFTRGGLKMDFGLGCETVFRRPEVMDQDAFAWLSKQRSLRTRVPDPFLPMHLIFNARELGQNRFTFLLSGAKPHLLCRVSACTRSLSDGKHSLLPIGVHFIPFQSLGLAEIVAEFCFGEAWVDACRGYFEAYCTDRVRVAGGNPSHDFESDERCLWSHPHTLWPAGPAAQWARFRPRGSPLKWDKESAKKGEQEIGLFLLRDKRWRQSENLPLSIHQLLLESPPGYAPSPQRSSSSGYPSAPSGGSGPPSARAGTPAARSGSPAARSGPPEAGTRALVVRHPSPAARRSRSPASRHPGSRSRRGSPGHTPPASDAGGGGERPWSWTSTVWTSSNSRTRPP